MPNVIRECNKSIQVESGKKSANTQSEQARNEHVQMLHCMLFSIPNEAFTMLLQPVYILQ